jgi:hypothetical protein
MLISIGCNETNLGMALCGRRHDATRNQEAPLAITSPIFQALKSAAGLDTIITGGGCVKLSMSHWQIRSERKNLFGSCLTHQKLSSWRGRDYELDHLLQDLISSLAARTHVHACSLKDVPICGHGREIQSYDLLIEWQEPRTCQPIVLSMKTDYLFLGLIIARDAFKHASAIFNYSIEQTGLLCSCRYHHR